MTMKGFSTQNEAKHYIRTTIESALEQQLRQTAMNITNHTSKKTSTSYLYLCYPAKELNPYPSRMPYTLRISDHDSNDIFTPTSPDFKLRLERRPPVDLVQEYNTLEKQYKQVLLSIQVERNQNKLSKYLQKSNMLEERMNKIIPLAQWYIVGDIDVPITEMQLILNQKINSKNE